LDGVRIRRRGEDAEDAEDGEDGEGGKTRKTGRRGDWAGVRQRVARVPALMPSRSRLRRVRTLAVNWASCRDESIPWVGVEARAIYSA
jgi:hypothetical protein